MASYHRVLRVFQRSIQDKSLECDYNIHPWEVLINGERWGGKIRLIGFVDVFFLISYSAESRFEKGIVIYKDEEAIRDILRDAKVKPSDINLDVVNTKEREKDLKLPEKYFSFKSDPIDYTIKSLGHEIGLKTEYPKTSLMKYEIKMLKSRNKVMKKHIRRGVTQHSLTDLMHDAFRLGIITHAEMTAQIMGTFFVGNTTDDVMRKYMDALGAASGPDGGALSNEV
ncbi:uncharacterized protein K441DRAFT_661164 [Cenococcum geophilum 1.58]|uniref:uncharacterized protein n=1 Tax=Cenococcum geophilum 1.58 TaxID=794803 RepID=UPI00358FC14B|nr:hypothetical protein K441DRAFT_661164 [Cenococcum geophilum 1.58]